MESEDEMEWKDVEQSTITAIEGNVNKHLVTEIIREKLEDIEGINVITKEKNLNKAAPEIIKIYKNETLPTQKDRETEIMVKTFSSLKYNQIEEVNCYCLDTSKNDQVKPECSILQGGNVDKDYYVAHEISRKEHRGITVILRFDPAIKKVA